MRIVYMGTPEFAVYPLKKIVEAGHEVVGVITQPDKPKNRGKKLQPTPVKEAATLFNIPVYQPERVKNNPELIQLLREMKLDLIVVAAYGKILPKEVLEMPRLGCINIHASLLPKLRGAAPIQWAILEGFDKTGITLMQMAEGLDTGDILGQESIKIEKQNTSTLHDALSVLGGNLLIKMLPEIEAGSITSVAQEESEATYAPMITKQMGLIDFGRSAQEIERQIRGMDPWPSAFTYYEEEMVKLKEAEVKYQTNASPSGTILKVSKEGMEVACGENVLLVKALQFPNKKVMQVAEYIKGNMIKEETVLGMGERK